jgi:hypothetical protein
MFLYIHGAKQAEIMHRPNSDATHIATGNDCFTFLTEYHRMESFTNMYPAELLSVYRDVMQATIREMRQERTIHIDGYFFHRNTIAITGGLLYFARPGNKMK